MEKCGMHPKNCPPEPVKLKTGSFTAGCTNWTGRNMNSGLPAGDG